MTATTLHELLWDVSYHAMIETVLMREHVFEVKVKNPKRGLPRAHMPEEATTINLARRLAVLAPPGTATVALHSRAVEGGSKRYHRAPSGADMQLALLLPSGRTISLLLQAKRLYPKVRANPRYGEWSARQNAHLERWAWNHGQQPGMLLYNDLVPPFTAKRNPNAGSDFTCAAFGACQGANQVQLNSHAKMMQKGWDLFDGTPGGVSLCINSTELRRSSPDAAQITIHHFPLEHLAHIAAPGRAPGGGGSRGGDDPDGVSGPTPTAPAPGLHVPESPKEVAIELFADVPVWASDLLELARTAADLDGPEADEAADVGDNSDFWIASSVVLDFRRLPELLSLPTPQVLSPTVGSARGNLIGAQGNPLTAQRSIT
ncbi:hypothetical protein FAM23877_11450 [Propionibacterium freudenreichii]|uniref:hypothetical protein n=1 Tax=Propionibacterium freudenreichii TaxID=1744 RepID=UPI00248638B0|nr:hypothetical protein [Propionibacterium freudenreichii]WGU90249.1 hypothetical protein FAM23877_11450 [Propionibacterium freudenreichii]